jgi:hypothetical protein
MLLGTGSPFGALLALADWLHGRVGATAGIALPRLASLLFDHITAVRGMPLGEVADAIADDYCGDTRRRLPRAIREHVTRWPPAAAHPDSSPGLEVAPARQRRHARGSL